MGRKRKRYQSLEKSSYKTLNCKCGTSCKVDSEVESVTCHLCVCKMVGIEVKTPKDDSSKQAWREDIARRKREQAQRRELYKDFPRGWHLKYQYTHKDGRKFQRGKEVKEFTNKAPKPVNTSGKPRGWHLMKEFVFEGVTYNFGKVVETA